MYGIIDENKKFILLDDNRDRLRTTALMLSKETEDGFVPMFDEDTVDEAISEYEEADIETAYNNDKYVKGYAPVIDNEYQRQKREMAYEAEVDPISCHISRLKDKEQTPEIIAEIEALQVERDEKITEIKDKYPYSVETN